VGSKKRKLSKNRQFHGNRRKFVNFAELGGFINIVEIGGHSLCDMHHWLKGDGRLYILPCSLPSVMPWANFMQMYCIVLYLYIYIALLTVHTNQKHFQCERPIEKRVVLRERKEALGLPAHKVDRVEGRSLFQSERPMIAN